MAAELGVPRMIFVNKLDRERAGFERTLDQLRDRFGAGVAPLELPIGEEADFRGIADLLTDTAFIYEDGEPHHGRDPRRDGGARAPGPRQPRRGHRRRRRRAARALPRRRRARRSRSSSTRWPHGVADGQRVPGGVRLGHRRGRHRPAGRLHLRDRPVARRPARRRGRRPATTTVEVAPDPAGRAARLRVQDDRRPVRRPGSLFKVLSGTVSPTTTSSTRRTGTDERLHGLFTLRGKEQEPASELRRRRHRRGRQAGRHRAPATRWPPRARRCVVAADRAARAGAGRRHRAPHPGRRGQAGDRPAPPAGRGPGAARRAQRRDPPDPAAGHGRDPPRDRARAAARASSASTSTPRTCGCRYRETITGDGRGRGQVQEADRRPRPVRRGLRCASSRSTGARASSSSTRSSAARSPASSSPRCEKGVEETMAHGRRLRLPGRRRAGRRCYDGKYHSVDSLRDGFKMAGSLGVQGGDGQGRRRSCSSRSRRLEVTVPADLPGRRDGRPQRPPGPGAGHRAGRRRRADDHRPGADVGDPALRHRPALDDRRPGPVHRRRTTTTTRCRPTSSTRCRPEGTTRRTDWPAWTSATSHRRTWP